jgi:hypothetical protein
MTKKIIIALAVIMGTHQTTNAYTIGGAYATLISCNWGQYGYEYGHIGTYDVNGKIYQIFFGNSYCQY